MVITIFLGENQDIPLGTIIESNDYDVGMVIEYNNVTGLAIIEVDDPVTYLTSDIALDLNLN